MAIAKTNKQFVLFSASPQSDRTTAESVFRAIAISRGGFSLNPNFVNTDVPTLHKRRGIRYRLSTARNSNAGQIQTPLFPDDVNYILSLMNPSNGSDGDINYWTLQHYWTDAIDTYVGRELAGVLFTGFQMSLDRNNPDALTVTLPCIANRFSPLTGAVPSPSFSSSTADGPYRGTDCYVDLNIEDSFITSGWWGDEPQINTLSLNLDRAVQIRRHKPDSSDPELEMTWSGFVQGDPTLTIEAQLSLGDIGTNREALLEYFEDAVAKQGSLRVMAKHGRSSSYVATIPSPGTPGTKTVTLASQVADPAGNYVANSDYVLIQDTSGTYPKIEVLEATSVTGGPPPTGLDITTTLAHTATVNLYDKAFEIRVPKFTVDSAEITEDGEELVVNISASAILTDTDTDVWDITRSYDD